MTVTKVFFAVITTVMTALACAIQVPGTGISTFTPVPSQTRAVMTVTETPTLPSARVIAMQSLNVRGLPGHDKPVIGALYAEDTVVMTRKCHDGWAEIVWKDGTAWVNAYFLSENKCSEGE